jgi:hypothetical protein
MIDLSLIPMDDMVEEMKKRFDTIVILTRRQLDKDNDDMFHHFKDKIGCLGLMKIAENHLVSGYKSEDI